jgi:hypothetical protein
MEVEQLRKGASPWPSREIIGFKDFAGKFFALKILAGTPRLSG